MVEIRQLNPTRSNLKKFVEFQIDLYKGNPYFVPPLVSDEIATLDSKVNPAFDHPYCRKILNLHNEFDQVYKVTSLK